MILFYANYIQNVFFLYIFKVLIQSTLGLVPFDCAHENGNIRPKYSVALYPTFLNV